MKTTTIVLFLFSVITAIGQSKSPNPEEVNLVLQYANQIMRIETKVAMDTARYASICALELDNDSLKAHSLKSLGRAFSALGQYDSAKTYFLNAHRIYGEINDKIASAKTKVELGIISRHIGDYKGALEYYSKAEKVFEANEMERDLGLLYRSIAIIKKREHLLIEALEYYLKSETYAQQFGTESELAAIQNGISTVFKEQKKYTEAINYLVKALNIYSNIDDHLGKAGVYNNLGDLYLSMQKYDSAIYYSDLSISERPKNSYYDRGVAISEYNKGVAYREMESVPQAITSLEKSAALFQKMGDIKSVIYPRVAMIELYRKIGSLDQALVEAEQTLEAALESQSKGALKNLYQTLSEIHKERGDFKQSLVNIEKFMALKDSLLNEQNSNQLIEMETKYETEKKEQQIESLNQGVEIASLRIRNQRFFLLGAIILILLLILAGYLLFILYSNRSLKTTQQKLITEQKLLRSQMNPHFLFNALASINAFIFKGDKYEASEYLNTFSQLTRNVLIQSTKEWITLKEELSTVSQYLEIQKLRFGKLSFRMDTNDELNELLVPPVLLQPFVENSIVHGFQGSNGGTISIKVSEIDDQLLIEISDTGIGLSKEVKSSSKALEITRSRLALLYPKELNEECLNIFNRMDDRGIVQGVTVRLVLPIKESL